MRKILILVAAALALGVLAAAPASAGVPEGVVLPNDDGTCPAGFTLGYSDEFGVVCTEVIERDRGDRGVTAAATLPRTGSNSLPLAQIGVVLVSVGALVVLAARKRADVVNARS